MLTQSETLRQINERGSTRVIDASVAASKVLHTMARELNDSAKASVSGLEMLTKQLAETKTFESYLGVQRSHWAAANEQFMARMNKFGQLYLTLCEDTRHAYSGA